MLLAASGAVTFISTASVLTVSALSPRLVDRLPKATLFVILFGVLGVVLLFIMGWIAKRYRL